MPKVNLFKSQNIEKSTTVTARVPLSIWYEFDKVIKEKNVTASKFVAAMIEAYIDPGSDQVDMKAKFSIQNNDASDLEIKIDDLESEIDLLRSYIEDLEAYKSESKEYINHLLQCLDKANKNRGLLSDEVKPKKFKYE